MVPLQLAYFGIIIQLLFIAAFLFAVVFLYDISKNVQKIVAMMEDNDQKSNNQE